MLTFKSPDLYVNEPGALQRLGALTRQYGRRAYLIGGETALKRTGATLEASLKAEGIEVVVEINTGEVTLVNIEHYANKLSAAAPDFIVGAGGGKVLDLVKAVGERLELPVVTVPTIAATCAAWSALTILHDDEGRADGALFLKASPRVIVADTAVLAEAPRRYLASGIGDTLAKWYEVALNLQDGEGGLDIQLSLHPARLALEIIGRSGEAACRQAETGASGEAFKEVVDAIIVLTGLAGTVGAGKRRALVAHAIHDSLTHLEETKSSLHGEKVGFCLIIQSLLEGREDIHELISTLLRYELPVTLAELGIDREPQIIRVAEGSEIVPAPGGFAFPYDSGSVETAIRAADELGRQALKNIVSFSTSIGK
ncbi:iron-containing alcohol dehydrogenase family protein [Paenibacillus borealis]|uniref:iron-containing alcohol dehydrogenase family protein n=1 Tax=Paenibacillus borealis TaxID=160799 RepID=UPI0005A9197A|nr:iron-containing alcohol dehydrogenase family protein [Paenibacillus borealis]